jgi:hypothetical protein
MMVHVQCGGVSVCGGVGQSVTAVVAVPVYG